MLFINRWAWVVANAFGNALACTVIFEAFGGYETPEWFQAILALISLTAFLVFLFSAAMLDRREREEVSE